jgi:release factor glutamine methyltransferase
LSSTPTIGAAQAQARRALDRISETPTLDSQLILADLLGRPRAWVLAHPEFDLGPVEQRAFADKLARLADGEPLAYVLGWWEFYGRRFRVTSAVLIPRPETELLVERALDIIRIERRRLRVVEVGTGSGCVAVSLAAEVPGLHVTALDVSGEALAVCSQNARLHTVDSRVHLICGDMLAPLAGPLDLVVGNLPYIASGELASLAVSRREPKLALDGGPDGLGPIRRLLGQARELVADGGTILLEIGAEQGSGALELGRAAFASGEVRVGSDLAGRDRLLEIRVDQRE